MVHYGPAVTSHAARRREAPNRCEKSNRYIVDGALGRAAAPLVVDLRGGDMAVTLHPYGCPRRRPAT
jgi:hypothetical protein